MTTRPATRPTAPGDELSVDIDSLADGPDALAKVDNYVLFVPGALPGERVRVRVRSAGRKFGRAELLEVERAAPERVAPRCAHFGTCGGCHWQHIAYQAQLRTKVLRLQRELVHALGVDDVPVQPVAAPLDPWQQRTKVVLHLEGRGRDLRGGFFRLRSHDLVDIDECPVSDPRALALAHAAVAALRRAGIAAFQPDRGEGLLRTVVVRVANKSGEVAVLLVAAQPAVARLLPVADALLEAGATGVALNVNDGPLSQLLGRSTRLLRGRPRIVEEILGLRYLVSPSAFFQTSAFGTEWLVSTVLRLVAPVRTARVLDLYCGAGLFALALAQRVREVVGIEENPAAVRDAATAARLNRVRNARIIQGRVERRFADAMADGARFDAVVVDPPRAGLTPEVGRAIVATRAPRLVYVSCNPDTLGRDLADFVASGYVLRTVEPVDMFPHTCHVEAVAALERPVAASDGALPVARR